jgi:HEAT repeat protein
MGFTLMSHLIIVLAFLLQNPSLDSESPKERQAAVEKLAVLGNRQAIPELAAALKKEPKSDIRVQIVAALGRIGDREAIPILAETLQNDVDKEVRSQAIDSTLRLYIPIQDSGQLHNIFTKAKSVFVESDAPVVGPEMRVDASAKEALARVMQKDFDDNVRAQASRALGSLMAKDQVPTMIATLEDPKNREHSKVRVDIVHSLGVIRDPAAGPALAKALRDPDPKVVEEAIPAVGKVGYKEARPELERIFQANDRITKTPSLQALAMLKDPASVPFFEPLLSDKNDRYRELSAEGLARVNYPGAKDWRTRLDQEKKPNVRNALAYGLIATGDTDYINNLAEALDSGESSQAEVYLFELGKYNGKLDALYRYLKSSNPKVRAGTAKVLGNIGDPASSDQIKALTNDPNTDVVREAVAALRKLGK